jgi:low temperature requirement protein LtrA
MTVEQEPDSTVEWLELFFDLVVVVAIAVVTEGLHEDPTLEGVAIFALLYGSIWLSWVSVVLYADVAAERTRVPTVVWAMFLVAIMAATAPAHYEHRANLFAGAFLLVRVAVSQASLRTGRVLVSWPLLQFGGLAVPWIVAMWVPAPHKFVLWGLGLGLDLLFVLLRGEADPDEMTERLRRRLTRDGSRGAPSRTPSLEVVDVNRGHLGERLGLLVIIVLGEAVSQLVIPAASTPWGAGYLRPLVAGFLILVGLWWLTFNFGFTAAPSAGLAAMRPRFALPLHLCATFGIVCVAAGLGQIATDPGERLGDLMRWLMCVGLTLYFLVTTVSGLAFGASRRWLLGWALPCTLLPLLLAGLARPFPLSNTHLAVGLLVCVGWMVVYSISGRRRTASSTKVDT